MLGYKGKSEHADHGTNHPHILEKNTQERSHAQAKRWFFNFRNSILSLPLQE